MLRLFNWWKVLSTGYKISLYPVSKAIGFPYTIHWLDGDSSTRRKRYLTFEHLGPDVYDNDSQEHWNVVHACKCYESKKKVINRWENSYKTHPLCTLLVGNQYSCFNPTSLRASEQSLNSIFFINPREKRYTNIVHKVYCNFGLRTKLLI